jgi:hypothetical protein
MYVLLGGLAFIALVTGVASILHEGKLRKQKGIDRHEFTALFQSKGIPASISGAVYDAYKVKAFSKKFNPAPEMNLEKIFNQEREDVDDEALLILKQLRISKPAESVLLAWSGGSVDTVGDLVEWIYWVSKQQVS